MFLCIYFCSLSLCIGCFAVKQVFSEMDFLGWYTTGDTPTPAEIKIHKQVGCVCVCVCVCMYVCVCVYVCVFVCVCV